MPKVTEEDRLDHIIADALRSFPMVNKKRLFQDLELVERWHIMW
ncbi:hypothetical protein [Peribacillus sp. NPDC097895]